MRPSRLTIRARITGGSLLIAILISVVAGILIYSEVRRIVTDGQVAVLETVEGPYLTALAEAGAEEVDDPGPGQLVAVRDPTGVVQINTLPTGLSSLLGDLIDRSGETRTVAVGGTSYLVRVTEVAAPDGAWHIVSATNDEGQINVLNQVALLLIVSIAGINLAFGAASWLIGTAALAPVTRLRRSATQLAQRPGSELLPVGPARDEIAELAHALNVLISELRASAERERQIVSDASHEIRTPLAILTTQLELAQAQATTLPQLRTDVAAAQRMLERLTGLATSLLELSRIDAARAGTAIPGTASLDDLAMELADAADRGRQRVGGRDIRIDYTSELGPPAAGAAEVAVSVGDFGRVGDNLVNNALAALGETGSITLSLTVRDGDALLVVSDDAGGMDEGFVSHAFDRFSRSATARTGTGAGLGLAIVEGIATVAGGTVKLDNMPGIGLTVEVRFPIGDDETGGAIDADPSDPSGR